MGDRSLAEFPWKGHVVSKDLSDNGLVKAILNLRVKSHGQ